jgi:hypothetical protein
MLDAPGTAIEMVYRGMKRQYVGYSGGEAEVSETIVIDDKSEEIPKASGLIDLKDSAEEEMLGGYWEGTHCQQNLEEAA